MQFTPTPHFVSFAQGVLYRAGGLDIVWRKLAALAGITTVFFGVSLMRFRTTTASFQSVRSGSRDLAGA
jgi:ABC-2 type transport system permease protein